MFYMIPYNGISTFTFSPWVTTMDFKHDALQCKSCHSNVDEVSVLLGCDPGVFGSCVLRQHRGQCWEINTV